MQWLCNSKNAHLDEAVSETTPRTLHPSLEGGAGALNAKLG